MRFSRVWALGLLFLALASLTWSQTGTSAIRGTITDQQGRVVPGATVTLTNTATNATRTTKSTDAGIYVFDLIQPGMYRVDIEVKGFKKQTIAKLEALIGKPTDGSTQLEVGTSAEVVEVNASAQEVLVNTQDATLGNNFINQQITQLPLEARNVIDLLSLQPGATREGYVTGARADQSNITLDGVDINNAQTANTDVPHTYNQLTIGQVNGDRNNITTGPVLRLNSEAIEEFRVTTASANANQGRSAGSQVNLVTKSGTNSFHGAAFELYRTRGFTSNNWFNLHSVPEVAREPLERHTYGGGIGGPIIRNKLFFFYSYEGRHDSSGQSQVEIVPLASLGQGQINYIYCLDPSCTGTNTNSLNQAQVQAAYSANGGPGLNPTGIAALAAAAAKYPANDTTVGDGLNTSGFRFNALTPTKLNSHVLKLDFNLTSRQVAFVRANVIYDNQTLPRWLPDTPAPQVWNHPRGIAAGHTWTIGTRWVNNFRYGLTRQAFTQGGDSVGNDISFRFVFQPTGQQHPISRVTPVHNFTDDVSYIRGNHNIQFGANIRKINNSRIDSTNAYDNAVTNPSFYLGAGEHLNDQFQKYLDANSLPGSTGAGQSLNSVAQVQNAATALIGRFSQFTANYTFGKDGALLAAGIPTNRDFATQAYDTYVQDTWKTKRNLTLTLGLRYSLERPVYETQGFEVQPEIPLGTYFANRLASAAKGVNYVAPIVINRSGPANGGKPMYNWNKTNFQPRLAFAWSLDSAAKSVMRGGFSLTNDYYGQALAVDWDINNTLGFTSNFTTPANTYDTCNCGVSQGSAPLFTSFTQDIRGLAPSTPSNLQFPLSQPLDQGERIEQSVDSTLHAPREYVWNLTFERQLPANSVLTLSYIGRSARRLLARRDVVAFNNLRDPKSGMTWYQAGRQLEIQRQQGIDTSQIATIPFFENVYPAGLGTIVNNFFGLDPVCSATDPVPGFDPTWTNTQVFYAMQSRTPANPCFFFSGNDWTDTQALLDQVMAFNTPAFPTLFMQPQYGALSSWATIGNSNYNALAVSLRTRLSSLTLDFNYTWSHSLDDASGLQSETNGYGNNQSNGAFIVNPIRQGDNYANSDFDNHHVINANAVWQMPFGRGKALMGNASKVVDAIFGGWQLSGIFRWNSGLPVTSPFDDARWATNWNVQAYVTPLHPLHTCPSRPTQTPAAPKLFGNCDLNTLYQSFRNAYPGETGTRNYLRAPGYIDVDLGISKTWKMPYREGHQLQLRWDVFNVANSQSFATVDDTRTGFGVGRDPALRHLNAPGNWSNFNGIIQGDVRVMQIGARYSF